MSPKKAKSLAIWVLVVVTGIFLFFPACIFSGASVCWEYDVTDSGIRSVLLVSSAIILGLCFWIWINLYRNPKLDHVHGTSRQWVVFLAVLISVALVIFAFFELSDYWASFVEWQF